MIPPALKPSRRQPAATFRSHPRGRVGSATPQAVGPIRDDRGFSLIEAIVASLILVVGLLAAFMILVVSTHSATDTRARENAVTLARQITETARSLDYSQISNGSIVSQLQAQPGLANTSSGSTWTIVRNGFTYTLTAGVTTVNDAHDASGAVDLKQVRITVSWSTYTGLAHSVSETATMSAAGQDPGLITSNLLLASPTSGYSGTSAAPVITSALTTALTFSVTAPAATTKIIWSLNGGTQATWQGGAPSGTTWTSAAWTLSGVSDGSYTLGAQAEDASGVDGPVVTIPVRLVRNVPSAPSRTGYGFNPNLRVTGTTATAVELQWTSNPELNVVGYNIYAPVQPGPGTATLPFCQTFISSPGSCSINGGNAWCSVSTTCIDLSPPSTGASNLTYQVRALYYDANNVLQVGAATAVTVASGTQVAPQPPPLVTMTVVVLPDDTANLTWTQPTVGTAVSFYRIYRSGNRYPNRYDVVPASSCTLTCTYHDTNRVGPESYWITSVGGTTLGADMAESLSTGPVAG